MKKIIVMNAKGGCGKSTIATNIVSYYAAHGYKSALFDHDPQGSSMQWLKRRPEMFADIYGVAAYHHGTATTRAWQLRVPPEIQRVVVDTPAGIKGFELKEYLNGVTSIVVPVLPSTIDINATASFLRELLLVAKVRMDTCPIYIVPNRVKPNTNAFRGLENFLNNLNIPIAPQLRDTVNYIRAAELGLGVYDLPLQKLDVDKNAWDALMHNIDNDLSINSNSAFAS